MISPENPAKARRNARSALNPPPPSGWHGRAEPPCRLFQTPLLRRLRLYSDRAFRRAGPPLEDFTAQEPPKTPPGPPRTPQGPPQSAPRCLQNRILAFLSRLCCHLVGQVAARTRTRRQDDVKIAFRCQFEPNLAQLKPILDLTWPHLGPPDLLKTLIFHRLLKVFAISPICVLRRPREPQDGPDRPPRGFKRAPRAPQRAPRWPQEAPKRPQDGPKRLQEGPR